MLKNIISIKNHQSGFTLIEVLVAIIVLAIGLLGLAALQADSLRNNHSAYLRSQATILAYEIIDRMRASRERAINGEYDITLGDAAPTGSLISEIDLAEWKNSLANLLPSGNGSIQRTGRTLTVLVQWNDQRNELDLQQFSVATDL